MFVRIPVVCTNSQNVFNTYVERYVAGALVWSAEKRYVGVMVIALLVNHGGISLRFVVILHKFF